jgi:uncharacterized phiE125 gp8 family phage protein
MYSLSIAALSTLQVTLAEAKLHLRVDFSDEDAVITRLIYAATDQAEIYMGRSIEKRLHTLKLKEFPSGREPLLLPRPPLANVETSITYFNTAGSSASILVADLIEQTGEEPMVVPARYASWPSVDDQRPLPISIPYQAGYTNAAAVPSLIKQAILLQVGALYEFRENLSETPAAKIALGFHDLLRPYVVGDDFRQYEPGAA